MITNKDLELHTKFQSGNVVRWDGGIYVVTDIRSDSLVLIPIRGSNIHCHPSTKWPSKEVCDCRRDCVDIRICDQTKRVTDPTKTVDTIVRLHDSIYDWLHSTLNKILGLR